MGDEVTKKDLQGVQANCNKQIAELEKRMNTKVQNVIDSSNKAFTEETDRVNKVLEGLNKTIETYNKGFADLTKRLNDLVAVVNQHAKAINERD